MPTDWLKTKDLCRYFERGPQCVKAVDSVDLAVNHGDFLAVVGSSGSGKSTLLALMAGLGRPTRGRIEIDGVDLWSLSRQRVSAYRAHQVGMVFQSFNLIAHRTALQNVELSMFFDGTPSGDRQARAIHILEKLGLGDRLEHRPADLSGGEQQRVALARAMVKNPQVIFADEPTGNLDQTNSEQIVDLLSELNQQGTTIVMVTHDLDMARAHAGRLVRMHYGKLEEERTQ